VTHGPNFRSLDRRGARSAITVHDLAFLHFPDDYPPGVVAELTDMLERQQWFVDEALCDSAASEQDLVDAYPAFRGRTSVVQLGVDESWFEQPGTDEVDAVLGALGLRRPFIFHLGAMVPRKDLPTLVRAWLSLRRERPDLGLVLAGPSADSWKSDRAAVADLLDSAPGDAHAAARVLGRVDDGVARKLMAAAAVYCTTSKLEGFGLPVLEAMAARVPVVATRDRAIMEVGGDHVRYAPIGDSEAIAGALAQALDESDPARLDAAMMRAREFTWRGCAEQTLESYRRLLRAG
jgi:alpha-1,3-rhamnosyl/mannosyltransferase